MSDLLSSISVLLVFLTFLLNTIEKEVGEKIKLRKPDPEQQVKRREFVNDLRILLFLKVIPVTAIFAITFYSLLPKSVDIIANSEVSCWHFDELKTVFVFIEMGILGLSIYAAIKVYQLIAKMRE